MTILIFNPHSHAGSDLQIPLYPTPVLQISIHTPHAGSDLGGVVEVVVLHAISIHTPHAGSDSNRSGIDYGNTDFNPHSPCGERPASACLYLSSSAYFNPHSPCGERPKLCHPVPLAALFQSTLPMRGATVLGAPVLCSISPYFNPHSPCGERRHCYSLVFRFQIFQSTLPMRGATRWVVRSICAALDFNPHSPCGERRFQISQKPSSPDFNPHSPCGERRSQCVSCGLDSLFQSTLPMRGATVVGFPAVPAL